MAKNKKTTIIKTVGKRSLISTLDPSVSQSINSFESPYESRRDVDWDKTTKWKINLSEQDYQGHHSIH